MSTTMTTTAARPSAPSDDSCPTGAVAVTDRSATRCPIPSTVVDALTWPAIPGLVCAGDHEDGRTRPNPQVVVTGVFTGRLMNRGYFENRQLGLCLLCATDYVDELRPDPLPSRPDEGPPVIPNPDEYENYQTLLRWQSRSVAERIAATGEDRSCGPLTEAEYERGMVTGLPRPMVDATIAGFYLSDEYKQQLREQAPDGEYVDGAPKRLPTPWVNGWHSAVDADFLTFREEVQLAHDERRCCICGDQVTGEVAIAAAYGRRKTSAGWGHPRCVVLAVRTCPHFTDPFPASGVAEPKFATVAWRWDGDGVGVSRPGFQVDDVEQAATPLTWDELRAWARDAPWG